MFLMWVPHWGSRRALKMEERVIRKIFYLWNLVPVQKDHTFFALG